MRFALPLLLASLAAAQSDPASTKYVIERRIDPAKEVIVIVNDAVAESPTIGKEYCQKRHIPGANVLHVKTTNLEVISWPLFRDQILKPFLAHLEKFPDALYVIPVWGVPSRISEEDVANDAPKDQGEDTITKFVTNRDYACLDAELALARRPDHKIEGWIESDVFGRNEPITVANKLLLVSRLDGPSAEIARALVDKALHAEMYGLEGHNYLDTRGLPGDTSYGYTDEEMRQTLKVFTKHGIELAHEDTETEQDVSKLADTLFYWGWYAEHYNGTEPFSFRTGAVAAHLHSCSACSVRTDSKFWVGPFLQHGVTCTTGTVFEPLTAGFPRMHLLYDRLFQGYTWGQAAAMSNQMLSWMAVFVGDPLYAPYAAGSREPQEKNRALAKDGYGRAVAAVDAADLDGATAVLTEMEGLPVRFERQQDASFLKREIASRRKAPATGTLAELEAVLKEGAEATDPKLAEDAYRKALTLSPMCIDALISLGEILLDNNKAADALIPLGKAREVDPASPRLALPLGRALAETGKYKEAIPILEEALKSGVSSDVKLALGECHIRSGDVPKAVAVLSEAAKSDPKHLAVALALARALESAKDYAAQMAALKQAVTVSPTTLKEATAYREIWQQLASAARRAKDRKEEDAARLVLKDFQDPAFALPSGGQYVEINADAGKLAAAPDTTALGTIKSRDQLVPGLPRLLICNVTTNEFAIYFKGACPRTAKARPLGAKPETRTLGLYPGEYTVVLVVAKNARERTTFTGTATFELNKEYGLCLDANLALDFPPK